MISDLPCINLLSLTVSHVKSDTPWMRLVDMIRCLPPLESI